MNVLETLLSSGSGQAIQQVAGRFGITHDQASSSLLSVLPALAAGMKEKLSGVGGAGLSDLISSGSLTKFADDPSSLGTPGAIEQGKSILNQVFGSQDLSNLSAKVAEKAGVSSSIISRLLPIAATLLTAVLSRNRSTGGDVTGMLDKFAAVGHSGVADAVKSLAAKILG